MQVKCTRTARHTHIHTTQRERERSQHATVIVELIDSQRDLTRTQPNRTIKKSIRARLLQRERMSWIPLGCWTRRIWKIYRVNHEWKQYLLGKVSTRISTHFTFEWCARVTKTTANNRSNRKNRFKVKNKYTVTCNIWAAVDFIRPNHAKDANLSELRDNSND